MTTRLLKTFQIEDLARAACVDGAIIAWEQGLGKSLAAVALAIIKEAKRSLIICPASLQLQITASSAKFFGKSLRPVTSLEDFYRLKLDKPHKGPPRIYVTSYTALGLNNGDEWSPTFGHKGEFHDSKVLRNRRKAYCLAHGIKWNSDFSDGIGETRRGITCIFAPTLARVAALHESFDCVVVDEGTRLQATESRMAASVRLLDPAYRYILTGTPIKNRLESIFWLGAWVGRRYGRWPYQATDSAREQFANTFLQNERFLTREENTRLDGARAYNTTRRSNRICAVHRLWKTLSPVIIRRRKADCGEDIPQKIVKPIIVPPGAAQLAVYQYHLNNPPLRAQGGKGGVLHRRVQVGMQLNLLRIAALCPTSDSLAKSFTGVHGPRRSWTEFTPKFAACISLVQEALSRGQQIIIGSPFTEFSKALHARLTEAGISSLLLDGSISPEARGQLAAEFKEGRHTALVAGLKAMGEGHSFENCPNLVLPSYSYAFDENEQFIHRVWRLNSPGPVTIYPIITQGTIDETMQSIFTEKGDSASLAIDGRLFAEQPVEVDLEWLLAQTIHTFNPKAATVEEQDILNQWEANLPALALAEARFRTLQPKGSHLMLPKDMRSALTTLKIPSPTQLTVDILRKHYKAGTYRKVTAASVRKRRKL